MNRSQTIICVMGTRPEVIKMAPVVKALRAKGFHAPILATAQHRGLLDQMLSTFELKPEWDLDVMQPGQTLASLTGILIPALENAFRGTMADAVLAQGDTATVFCSALAAYYAHIPFGHVEAGLRSGQLSAPFPEEGMRRLSAVLARWHFAPTETSKKALLDEGHAENQIHVVGNTVIDSLLAMSSRNDLPLAPTPPLLEGERQILITLHRRENFGDPLLRILNALREFSLSHPEARLIYPVHPNPNVKGPAENILGGLVNVHLLEPLEYASLVGTMKRSYMVLTDSGGLQEEAPALGKPVIVFRDVTERPEAVKAGGVLLVGSDPEMFLQQADRLWNDKEFYASMAKPRFPYGDGDSSIRIARVLAESLGMDSE